MEVSEICKIVQDCERLRSIILQEKHELTGAEQQEICDLLWDYRCELLWDYRCELLKNAVKRKGIKR